MKSPHSPEMLIGGIGTKVHSVPEPRMGWSGAAPGARQDGTQAILLRLCHKQGRSGRSGAGTAVLLDLGEKGGQTGGHGGVGGGDIGGFGAVAGQVEQLQRVVDGARGRDFIADGLCGVPESAG